MTLPIVRAGDAVLRTPTRLLTVEELRGAAIQTLIEQMREAMRAAPGVGLAAPQVGAGVRLCVIEDRADYQHGIPPEVLASRGRTVVPFHVLVNPRITLEPGEPLVFFEGCLSVPGYAARVARAGSVRVDALDEHGRALSFTASGWYARIIQHEVDHLDGVLYVDRMDSRSLTASSDDE